MSIRPARCAVALLALCCAVAVAACGGSGEPSTASTDRPLRIVTSFAVGSLDPVEEGFWMPEYGAAETPMRRGKDGTIEPWAIAALTREDSTTWKLRLRDDVTFQNGKPLDADALLALMQRQLAKSPSAQSVLDGASVRASAEREVTLRTRTPDAAVPAYLAGESVFPIYDVEAVERAGKDPAALAGKGIYTGPYAIRSLTAQELVLERYDGYWQGRPPLPGVSVRFVADPQARILAVRNGEADLALYPPTEAKQTIDGSDDAFYRTPPRGQESITMPLNLRRAPFEDMRVRRAFLLGIDYEALANDVLDGAYDVASGLYPSFVSFARQSIATDQQAAGALLDEAGWTPGDDGVRVKDGNPLRVRYLTYPQQPDTKAVAIAIQAQLKEIGFDVQVRQVDDITEAFKDPGGWEAGGTFSGTLGFYGQPEPFLRRYLVTNGSDNYAGIADPELDRLIAKLARTYDAGQREALLAGIQKVVVEQQAYLGVAAFKRFPVIAGPAYREYEPSPSLNHVTFETAPDA